MVADSQEAVSPHQIGTKAAAHYRFVVSTGETAVIRLRLSAVAQADPFGSRFDQIIDERRREADGLYRALTPAGIGVDAANVMRQALTRML